MKVFTKLEVDTTICCLVIALLLLIRYVTLTLAFHLLTLVSGHTWRVNHVLNPSTKFEDPTAIHS